MNFNKYAEKGNLILAEISEQLGIEENRERSYRILRAVLHVLRERLPVQESFHLMAQLPLVLKGVYADGWKYHDKPNRKIRDLTSFVREMVREDYPAGHHDFMTVKDAENAVRAVITVLRRHIAAGEADDIENALPADLKEIWHAEPV